MEHIRKFLRERPLTRSNILHCYIPFTGSLAYTGLGISVVQPGLARRFHPQGNDLTNVLLGTSITGAWLYLIDRKHLKKVSTGEKFLYCLMVSSMFNLGSLLLWAMLRSGTSELNAPQFKFFLVVGSAYWLTTFGVRYLETIDTQIPGK